MPLARIVVDTNVLVSALRSRRGASYRLLELLGSGRFEVSVSVPLVLEYEDVLKRSFDLVPLDEQDINSILDYICLVASHHEVFFLWRPLLRDPKDDMVLEIAVTSQASFIVTFNHRDFRGAETYGLAVVTPREFLQAIGETP